MRDVLLRTVLPAALTAIVVSVLTVPAVNRLSPVASPARDQESGIRNQERRTIQVVSEESAVTDAVAGAADAVVSVIISKDLPILEQEFESPFGEGSPFEDFFSDPFFSPFELRIPRYREKGTERREVGGGTAFFIAEDGLLLTNKHVVADEEATYTVLLNDGSKIPARVLTRDPGNDIALLQADLTGTGSETRTVPFLTFGDSSTVKLGQVVIAIGNALGEFRNTVSVGVVSGLSRSVRASGGGESEQLDRVIQTDAAINHGNSGGPLLNTAGQVIGINTAIAAGAQNIGFAIPIDDVARAVESFRTHGRIIRPYLGIRYVLITPALKDKNKLPYDHGALILRGEDETDLAVLPGSPADKAGLRENDIILSIDGEDVTLDRQLSSMVRSRQPGDTLRLRIVRQGKEEEVEVTLEEQPS